MRSALLDTTALSQPIPTPPGLLDARQIEHLRLADEMEARWRSLPRFGATFTAWALIHGVQAHRTMATMTEAEERAYLDEERAFWAKVEAEAAA